MATRTHRSMSIMPTVDGQRMPDLHHMGDVSLPITDEGLGKVVGDCLRNLSDNGFGPEENFVTLEIKFA